MGYQTINIHMYILFILCFQVPGPFTSGAEPRPSTSSARSPERVRGDRSEDDMDIAVGGETTLTIEVSSQPVKCFHVLGIE